MKRTIILIAVCASTTLAFAQSNVLKLSTQEAPRITISDIKKKYPSLDGLDDDQVVDALHQAFYSDLPREQVAQSLGIKPSTPTKQTSSGSSLNDYLDHLNNLPVTFPRKSKELGLIDKWRYESCQENAIKAPTPQGVGNGLRICRERFDQ